jgi:hypothetical protein
MFSATHYKRAMLLEKGAVTLQRQFDGLTNAKTRLDPLGDGDFNSLEVTQVAPNIIDASYLNVTVRFRMLLTYKDDKPYGRVVCLHKYNLFGKDDYDVLGEFGFDRSGNTDLSPSTDGMIRTLSGNADEIVVEFLDKAIEQGPQALAQAKI